MRGIRCGQLLLALAVAVFATSTAGQTPPDPPPSDEAANGPAGIQPITPGPMIAVHGVVRNAVSGEPLPRALVQVDGETGPGTLTDGDGRFDLTLTGLGSHVFQLTKPGFHDLPPYPPTSGTEIENNSVTHNIYITADLGGLSFALTPTSAIHGHIDLSTGELAQGLGVMLLRRTLQGGHASWQVASNTRTNSDGDYRFGGLDDGDYAIETEPARESDGPGFALVTSGSAKISSSGYAATYFPDAHDFSGASKIHLRGGESAQANLVLKLEPFQLVRAALPAAKGNEKTRGFGVVDEFAVLDVQGHRLSYPAQIDGESRTVQALLPDGTYALQVTELQHPLMRTASGLRRFDGIQTSPDIQQGTVDFTVAGHPVTNLRVPLAERVAAPVVVNVTRNTARPVAATTSSAAEVSIAVTQAGDGRVEGMWNQLAQGSVPGELETSPLSTGSYWVHSTINSPGLCESSFTAGSSSLGHEPLIVGASGATAPLSLTLRDDCASLKLTLPANLMDPATGEEPAFTVYVVPDFDSTVDISALVLRPSSGGMFTVENLTPGNYHVYAFDAPVELEYRNPEALARLANAGQAVTLEPLATSTLVVEEPPR